MKCRYASPLPGRPTASLRQTENEADAGFQRVRDLLNDRINPCRQPTRSKVESTAYPVVRKTGNYSPESPA